MNVAKTQIGAGAGQGGSALIIALWTIALLSMLVMSFALDAMLEGRISTYVRQRRRVDYLTQSGVAIAEMLLEKQNNVSSTSASDEEEDKWKEPALRIKRGQTAVVEQPIGDGVVRIEVIPEPARWNINVLVGKNYDEVWEQIFTTAGLPQELFSELIDCWNDWVDEDSMALTDGAEDDYYKSLEPPYKARNKQVDTVDELRLVKGFVPAILDGGVLNPEEKNKELVITVKGVKELFTTYGDGKINVNAAPMEVLLTIPGIDEITAGAIIEEREGAAAGVSAFGRSTAGAAKTSGAKTSSGRTSSTRTTQKKTSSLQTQQTGTDAEDYSFTSVADFMSRIPGLDSGVSAFVNIKSSTFRLVIEGQAAGITHTIEAIAEVENNRVRYLRWREDP
jgi:general secretion pathway protein K